MNDNPYRAPTSAVAPLDSASSSATHPKSAWRFLWVLLFAFLSGTTLLLVYAGVTMTVRLRGSAQFESVWIRAFLSILLVAIAGLIWLWASRCFWFAKYRSGWSAAALGFLALIAGFVIAPLIIESVP